MNRYTRVKCRSLSAPAQWARGRQGEVTAAVTRLTATRKRVARMKAQTGGQGARGGAAHR